MVKHDGPIIFSTQRAKGIVHIFDPPKLLKTIRNLYQEHQFLFKYKDSTHITSWNDVVLFYDLTDHTDEDSLTRNAHYFFPTAVETQCTAYTAKVFSKTVSMHLAELAVRFSKYSFTNSA